MGGKKRKFITLARGRVNIRYLFFNKMLMKFSNKFINIRESLLYFIFIFFINHIRKIIYVKYQPKSRYNSMKRIPIYLQK